MFLWGECNMTLDYFNTIDYNMTNVKCAAVTLSCGLSENTNRPPWLQDLHLIGLPFLSSPAAITLTSLCDLCQ